jgi:hypothetical protein
LPLEKFVKMLPRSSCPFAQRAFRKLRNLVN